MKVGLLSQWFAPEPGGGAVPTVLATGLAERGHDVRVLTGFPNYPTGVVYPGYRQTLRHTELFSPGVRIRRVPLYASHDARAASRALNYISFTASAARLGRRHLADADALWVFNSPATVPLVAEGVRKRYGVPYLLHIMDVWPDSVLESGMVGSSSARGVADRMLTSLVRRGYEGASTIAVTSPGQLSLLTSRGVPANRLEYCPVWADESVFHPQPCDRTLLPEKAQHADKVLMYAGALGHVQGLDAAVRAAAAVQDTGLQLVLVGSGIAEAGLRSLAESLQAENVHFAGRRSPAEMGALGSAADVHLVSLVDNPLLRVTMPSKLPSIMALGKPVIMCGAGDAADVVNEAGAGVVTAAGSAEELADVLRRLTDCEPRQLVEWGQAGRVYYEKVFSMASGVTHVESMLAGMSR